MEVAMTLTSTFASAEHRPAMRPRQQGGLAVLRSLIETYRARRRFRADLERMSNDNPHLIADIGLTNWQANTEIAKRFWEA